MFEKFKYIGDPDYRVYIVGIGERGIRIVQENRDSLLELAIPKVPPTHSLPPIIEFVYLTPEQIESSHFDCDYSFVVADLTELSSEQQASLFNHNDFIGKFVISPDKPNALNNDVIWLNQANDEITLKESILGVVESMLFQGYLSYEFLDIKYAMMPDLHLRKLHFSRGRAIGNNQTARIIEATNKAWECIPNSVIKDGTRLLIIVKSGLDLEFSELANLGNILVNDFKSIEDLNLCPVTILDYNMENEVEVIVIVSERME